jgi:hypothetical protein
MTEPEVLALQGDVDALSADALDRALAAGDRRWSEQLAAILAPPTDLAERCTEEVRAALLAKSVASTGADLLAVGWHTCRLLLSPDAPAPRRSPDAPEARRP